MGWFESGIFTLVGSQDDSNTDQGGEKYQQAFYVFEELAQAAATSSSQSMVSQAVSEIQLGRLEEAQAALEQVLKKDPDNAEAIANTIVLNVIAGKDASELIRHDPHYHSFAEPLLTINSSLSNKAPNHAFLTDLEEKSALFDKAATKYSAKVA